MRKLAVAFLFCLNSTIVYANDLFTIEKPVICSDVKSMIEFLSGSGYRESPFWVGKDEKSRYVLMVNEKAKTWSMVQFNDQVACILGTGEGHTLVLKGPKT
jgi:hypothetical protein